MKLLTTTAIIISITIGMIIGAELRDFGVKSKSHLERYATCQLKTNNNIPYCVNEVYHLNIPEYEPFEDPRDNN